MSLDGFGLLVAKTPCLSDRMLATKKLVVWPDPTQTGICKNQDAQRMNAQLLTSVADYWCPQWTSPAMIPIDEIKREVGFENCSFQCLVRNYQF